jgi:serine/threonine-protein kinase
VLDFGIARMASGTTLTHTSMVLGSAPYIAPEVAQGRPAEARSDIYSLGCVLYELLTGRAPFTGDLAAAVLHQHSTATPQAPAALNPAVPPALEALVMQMLAKAPADRPQRADELIAALGGALGAQEGTATTVDLAGTAPTRVLAPAPAGSRLGMMLAAAASLLALAVVLTILLSSGGRRGHLAADTTRNTPTHTASSTTPSTSTTTQSATTTALDTATTTASDTTSTASTTQTGPPSLAAASGALTTLLTQDLQSGTIDQQASQQILGQLQGVLSQYEQGQSDNAQQQLANLTKQIAQLTGHGDISPSAAAAISTAVGTFGTALANAAPVDNPGGPGHNQDQNQPGPGPPQHGRGHDH